jgi:hypothetical protein
VILKAKKSFMTTKSAEDWFEEKKR